MKSEEIINEIVKDIEKISGKHVSFEIFSDWVTLNAIGIQNGCIVKHDDIWQERENKLNNIKKKYTEKELKIIFGMYFKLLNAFGNEINDYLGEIFMRLSNSPDKKKMGQCFTPFSISLLNAKIAFSHLKKEEKIYKLYDPTCGAGGMIIASVKALSDKGINYKNHVKAIGQDLNLLCAYMTYVQLSLLNVDAIIMQCDTLEYTLEEAYKNVSTDKIFRTPRNLGYLML